MSKTFLFFSIFCSFLASEFFRVSSSLIFNYKATTFSFCFKAPSLVEDLPALPDPGYSDGEDNYEEDKEDDSWTESTLSFPY